MTLWLLFVKAIRDFAQHHELLSSLDFLQRIHLRAMQSANHHILSPAALLFLGDIYMPSRCHVEITTPCSAVVFNFEGPITESHTPWPGKVNLVARQNHLAKILEGVQKIACLANNHILDYGKTGLNDTVSTLAACDIDVFGAGSIAQNCRNPLIIEHLGLKIAFYGYVCPSTHPVFADEHGVGVSRIDLATIEQDLSLARKLSADRVVVCLHWGQEEAPLPKYEDVLMARSIIDEGADLIIGHHSHVIQSFELYNDKPIFYGLGNAFMPDLDLPSYFDLAGIATSRYRKRQHHWNRESLGVLWDPVFNQVRLLRFCFDRMRLFETGEINAEKYALPLISKTDYEILYNRALSSAFRRIRFHNIFTAHPSDIARWVVRHLRESINYLHYCH